MFNDLLQKKLKIHFYDDSNCNAFEISNFLSPKQYQSILDNIPSINKLKASRINPDFTEHQSIFEILNEVGFQKPIKHIWFKGQDVFNYTFNR